MVTLWTTHLATKFIMLALSIAGEYGVEIYIGLLVGPHKTNLVSTVCWLGRYRLTALRALRRVECRVDYSNLDFGGGPTNESIIEIIDLFQPWLSLWKSNWSQLRVWWPATATTTRLANGCPLKPRTLACRPSHCTLNWQTGNNAFKINSNVDTATYQSIWQNKSHYSATYLFK